jgi:hypothetical protein
MKHLLLITLAVLLCGPSRAAGRKPNFVFIYTDDHRWDAMGAVQREQGERARFPFFKSPGMERLAAEGVRFRNAFVTLSLCAPSRAASASQTKSVTPRPPTPTSRRSLPKIEPQRYRLSPVSTEI